MIRAAVFSLAGAWVAGKVGRGEIPERLAVPLTLLATRLPTPLILAGAIGYAWYRMNQEAQASVSEEGQPERPARSGTGQKEKSRAGQAQKRAQRPQKPSPGEAADV